MQRLFLITGEDEAVDQRAPLPTKDPAVTGLPSPVTSLTTTHTSVFCVCVWDRFPAQMLTFLFA